MGNKRNKHSLKSVAEEAKKYKGRTEFSRESTEAYQYTRRNNLLDEICQHMKVSL